MNKQTNSKDINKRIIQLERELRLLRIEATSIANRLTSAEQELKKITSQSTRKALEPKERKVSLEDYRSLTGKKVRVVNPKTIEEITGTVLKVGTLYVTIVLPNGRHLRRIANNLRLIDHD